MRAEYRAWYQAHAGTDTFARHVQRAREWIAAFMARSSAPYVAFSGGKDSTAMLGVLAEMGLHEVPVFTQSDDLDWPDKRSHCERVVAALGFADYSWRESRVSALEQFARLSLDGDMVHGNFSHVIEGYMRERQRNGVMLGLRAQESNARRLHRALRGGCYQMKKSGEWRCIPLCDWSGVDVFAFIVSRNLPYFHLYDCDDVHPPHELRMSCILHPLFVEQAAPFLRRHYPEQFARLVRINPRLRRYV